MKRKLRILEVDDEPIIGESIALALEAPNRTVVVAKDGKEAFRWYKMSAEQGFPQAQEKLAQLYFAGEVVPKNDVEAVRWFTLAANKGYVTEQTSLGVRYENG